MVIMKEKLSLPFPKPHKNGNRHLSEMEIILGDRFAMKQRIGSGCFGDLYEGYDISSKRKVALKLEKISPKSHQVLKDEAEIYEQLQNCCHIPRFFWFGSQEPYNILAIELMDNCLENLMKKCGGTFSLKTVLMLAEQMITAVECMHKHHFIHRDIKPENFMVGRGSKAPIVHVIDFGLSLEFIDPRNNQIIPMTEDNDLTGTARYASINALSGLEQSRRDDMESLGYLFVYFLKGQLPWQGLPGKTREEKYNNILNAKKSIPVEQLCSKLPYEFVEYLHQVKKLQYEDEPEYLKYKELFRSLFFKQNFVYDYQYDWCNIDEKEDEQKQTKEKQENKEKPQEKSQKNESSNKKNNKEMMSKKERNSKNEKIENKEKADNHPKLETTERVESRQKSEIKERKGKEDFHKSKLPSISIKNVSYAVGSTHNNYYPNPFNHFQNQYHNYNTNFNVNPSQSRPSRNQSQRNNINRNLPGSLPVTPHQTKKLSRKPISVKTGVTTNLSSQMSPNVSTKNYHSNPRYSGIQFHWINTPQKKI